MIPELNDQRLVNTYVHDTSQEMPYDMIMGMDLLQELEIDILNSTRSIKWGDQEIMMRPRDITVSEMMQLSKDPPAVQAETKRITDILDAKYEQADLKEVASNIPNISKEDRQAIFHMLKKYEHLFNGELGRWKGPPHTVHLKDKINSYHEKPYKIQQLNKSTLKAEVECLVKI